VSRSRFLRERVRGVVNVRRILRASRSERRRDTLTRSPVRENDRQ